jgi:hypothetical protein
MAYSLINPDLTQSVSCWLLAAWGILNAMQWLARLRQWGTGGAHGWDIQGLRENRLYGSKVLARVFQPKPLGILIVAQLTASPIIGFAPISWILIAALLTLIAASTLLNLRATADGADKMALVVAYGLLLQTAGTLFELPMLNFSGLLWVGGQLTLAYLTSGIGKLLLPGWRNGDVPRKTLSSYLHGHRLAHALIARPGVALTLAWSVILIESLFPLALFLPLPGLAGVLGAMALFHLATAAFMGLNTYPLAFIAAYPSLLLLVQSFN